MEKRRLLFVCLGNICRSPMAEAIAQKFISQHQLPYIVDSAGILSYHEGEAADPRMRTEAEKRGYHITSISRPVKWNDFETFDLILAMDDSNYDALLEKAPTPELANKVHRMAEYLTEHPEHDHIPDPYYGGSKGFQLVIDLLEDAITNLLTQESSKI